MKNDFFKVLSVFNYPNLMVLRSFIQYYTGITQRKNKLLYTNKYISIIFYELWIRDV